MAGGLNAYGFGSGDPVNFSDPSGLDAIHIEYAGYMVKTPFGRFPLGHGAVIAIDSRGRTRYYEYGRYDAEGHGLVRRRDIPNVTMGKDGTPTDESLHQLYEYISTHYGQGRPVMANYDAGADYQRVVAFAEGRMNDPNRANYNLLFNNCLTFADEAIAAGRASAARAEEWARSEPRGNIK